MHHSEWEDLIEEELEERWGRPFGVEVSEDTVGGTSDSKRVVRVQGRECSRVSTESDHPTAIQVEEAANDIETFLGLISQ